MSRRGLAAVSGVLVLAVAVSYALSRWHRPPEPSTVAETVPSFTSPSTDAALAKLATIPWYRAALRVEAVRGGSVDPDGTVHIAIDPRVLLAPRLGEASTLLPAIARGTIRITDELHEIWILEGPSPIFDLLDRRGRSGSAELSRETIPGQPSAVVAGRITPSRLAHPEFGGKPFAVWRERIDLAERMFGRPLRTELAEDLAGPFAFAVYDHADATAADALVAFALTRSDRIRGLLDAVFALGALTDRATTRRYRDVAIGAFAPGSAGRGLAFAVDGRVLFIATSATRLEAAIDARRSGGRPADPADGDDSEGSASWSARTTSSFVARGWSRLARAPATGDARPRRAMLAQIRPEGASAWRLEGRGPDPAITADPLLPFLRSVLARRQRDDG